MKTSKKIALAILTVLFALICAVAFSGCKTVQVVTEYRDSIQVRTEVRVDSVWRDRVRVEKMQGDTVRIIDSVTVQSFKWRDRVDSVVVRDSIPYPVEVQVPVKVRSGYDRFCSWGFWVLFLILLLFVAWRIFKRFYFRS